MHARRARSMGLVEGGRSRPPPLSPDRHGRRHGRAGTATKPTTYGSAAVHVEKRFPCTWTPLSDVHFPIDTERPLTGLKNHPWGTGVERHTAKPSMIDHARAKTSAIRVPVNRFRFMRSSTWSFFPEYSLSKWTVLWGEGQRSTGASRAQELGSIRRRPAFSRLVPSRVGGRLVSSTKQPHLKPSVSILHIPLP